MLDNLKLITYNQTIINRLAEVQDGLGFERYQHRNNNFIGFCRYGKLMRLDFRKSFENGVLVGFHHLEISISPHYHFNNYLHNGNDFTPENSIKTIIDILTFLKIQPQDYDLLQVVNIEFGLNIIPKFDVKNLIDGLIFYSTQPFVVPNTNLPYFKTTETKNTNDTKEKFIKAYAKGLQFADYPQYGIDGNTFRFEVKHKKARPTNALFKMRKVTVIDLLNLENYQIFSQAIIKEWDFILLLNQTPDFSNLKTDEVEFINGANKRDFLDDLNRLQFGRKKDKYYKILHGKNNLHAQIKGQIIDKLVLLQNDTFSPQRTPMNREKVINEKTPPILIKCENVSLHQNNRLCLVTKLDISMQRKGSKFLRETTLKNIKESNPEIYKDLEKKYLTESAKTLSEQMQIYLICKNIRDADSNPRNNRKRFEQRNYHPDQLQLF